MPAKSSSVSEGKEKSDPMVGDKMSGDEVLLSTVAEAEPTERTLGETARMAGEWDG